MAKIVDVAGVGTFSVPDTATPEQIQKFTENVKRRGGVVRAEAPAEPGQGGVPIISPLLSGAVTGLAEIPTAVRGIFDKKGAEAWRQSYSQAVPEFFGMDPTKEQTTTEMLAGGVGSLVPMLGASAISGGAATPLLAARLGLAGTRALSAAEKIAAAGKLASGVRKAQLLGGAAAAVPLGMGTAQQMATDYERRTGETLTPGQYAAVNLGGAGIGLFDLAPLGRWAAPIAEILQKVPASKALEASKIVNNAKSRFLGKVAAGAGMEGGQEAVSQIAQNLLAAGIYDPEQNITESVAENFALGAGVGGIVEGLVLSAAGIKRRKNMAAGAQLDADVQKRIAEAQAGITNQQGVVTQDTVNSLQAENPITGADINSVTTELTQATQDLEDAKSSLDRVKSNRGLVNRRLGKMTIPFDSMSTEDIRDLAVRLNVKPKEGKDLVDSISKMPKPKVLDAIINQQIDVMEARVKNAQRRFDMINASGTLAPRESVSRSNFRVDYRPDTPYSLGPVARAALSGGLPETPDQDVRSIKEAARIVGDLRKAKSIPGPRPDTSQMSEEEMAALVKASNAKTEKGEPPEYTIDQMNDDQLKKAMLSLELQKIRSTMKDRDRFAVVEEQYDGSGNKIGEAVVRRHNDKASAEKDVSSLKEASDPLAYQARMAPLGKKIKNVMAGMGLADVGFKFQQIMEDPNSFIEGQYDPRQQVISLVSGIYEPGMSDAQLEAKLVSVLNHEVIHAIRDLGLFTSAEWNTLTRAAATSKMPGKSYTAQEYVERLRPDILQDIENGVPGSTDLLQEESVAEYFRNWMANGKKPAPASSLLSRILNFFKRMFGFVKANNAEGIFEAIASGEIGNRARKKSPEPMPKPEPYVAPPQAPEEDIVPAYEDYVGTMYEGRTEEAPIRKMRKGKKAAPETPVAPQDIAPDAMSQPVEDIPFSFSTEGYGDQNVRLSSKVDLSQKVYKKLNETEWRRGLEEDLKRFLNGEITRAEWNKIAEEKKPVRPHKSVPRAPSEDDVRRGLAASGKKTIGEDGEDLVGKAHRVLKTGDKVKSRLDIPSYEKEGVWVETITSPEFRGSSYERAGMFTDVKFTVSPMGAVYIGTGVNNKGEPQSKFPMATVDGRWVEATPEEIQAKADKVFADPAWRQVGMDPTRHAYFYDRVTMEPVVGAEEVIQIGPLVLAKNPQYAPREDFKFSKISIPANLTGESEQEFARWWKDSEAVNDDGTPAVYYRGDPKPIRGNELRTRKGRISASLAGEEGPFFFTQSKKFANDFASTNLGRGGSGEKSKSGTMYPVYLSVQNAWNPENDTHVRMLIDKIKEARPNGLSMEEMFGPIQAAVMSKSEKDRLDENRGFRNGISGGGWRYVENPIVQRAIRDLGFDGFYVWEAGIKNLAVYSPTQVKSIFNQFEPGTAESRKFSKVSFIDDNNKLVISPYPEGNVGTSTRYIRLGDDLVRKKGVRVKVEDIGKAFDAITEKSDILDPAQRADIVNSIVDEINLQREQQNSGIGWYDSDVALTFDILAKEFPEFKDPYIGEANRRMFTVIAGIMSNGMKAKDNVIHGAANYRFFLENDSFSPINPNSGKGWNQRSNIMGPQIRMLNNMYKSERFAPRPGSNNPKIERMENFLEWMFSEHPVREINELRRESGIPSPAKIGKVDDLRLGMYAFGPKFGPFILNLNGRSDETVDNWASRSFYRHMGQAINQNGKMNDAPRTQAEREAMKAALRDVAQLSNLSSRDIQAVLWFYEKELYNKLGLKVPLEVFSDGAKEYIRRIEDAGQGKPSQGGRAQPRKSSVTGPKAGSSTARIKSPATEQQRAEITELVKKYPKYSAVAVPLNPSLQAAYGNAFAAPVQRTFFERLTDFFTGNAGLRFVQAVFNQDQVIESDEKAVYGKRIDASMSATASIAMARRAGFVSGAAIFNGIAPVQFRNAGDIQSAYIRAARPDEDAPSIVKIMAPIYEKGLQKQFSLYGIARRAKSKPGKQIVNLTDQQINEAIALEKQYPELKTAFEEYQKHNRSLIKMAVDSGRIEQGEANAMLEDLNYYGAYRVYEGELASPKSGGTVGGGSTIEKLSGQSDQKILDDPIELMIRNQTFWINASMKNIAALKAANLAVKAGEAVEVKGTAPTGAYTMVAYENGKKKTYMFNGPKADLWYNSLRSNDRQDWGKAMELFGLPAKWLRYSVTHDPSFILANLFRDALSTWGLRGEKVAPWKTFTEYVNALKGDSSIDAMRALGVGGGYDVSMKDPADQAKIVNGTLNKGVYTVTDPMKLVGALMQRLENLSEASDAATRAAVFKKVMEETGDEAEAAYRALEVMNFTKQGSSAIVQGIAKIVPFFNAMLQGKLVLGKSIKAAYKGVSKGGFDTLTDEERRLGKGMLLRGAVMAGVAMMLEMMNQDDDEYEDRIAPYLREQNFIIPLKSFGMPGTFIKIPKPFEFGTIFGTVPTSFYRWYSSENESANDVAKTMVQQLSSNIGFTVIPPALVPMIENYFNIKLYTGQPLVSRGKLGLDPSLQYNGSTGEVSKYLGGKKIIYNFETGQWEGIPPVILENYLTSYGGPLGTYLLMAADYMTTLGGVDKVGAATPVSKYPVIRRFIADAKDQNPAGADNLYTMIGMLDEVNRTMSYLRKIGDAEGMKAYVEDKKPILRAAPTIKALKKVASNIRKMDTAVNESKTMTADEKLQELRRINELEARYLDDIRKLKQELGL